MKRKKLQKRLIFAVSEAVFIIQTLFLVWFFMLLYCYRVPKPYHFDTVLYLVNVVSKLLYPNCTQHLYPLIRLHNYSSYVSCNISDSFLSFKYKIKSWSKIKSQTYSLVFASCKWWVTPWYRLNPSLPAISNDSII